MNRKTKRGGCFQKLFILLLPLGFAFGYVMVRHGESPSPAWRRIVDSLERLIQPKPASESPDAPSATPVAIPTRAPTPVPTATPVDPVAWLISNKSRWPREVTLLEATEFPALQDGKPAGFIKARIPSKVSVIEITANDVCVAFMGGEQRLPHKATDLAALAQATMEKAEAEASQPVPAGIEETEMPDTAPTGGTLLREKMGSLDARTAAGLMTPGINIGNTFDSVAGWETGWGSPLITKGFIQSLARTGFKSVRLPVAWDTFSDKGRITSKEFNRIDEIVNCILEAGMFCVVNIHWDGGWIDSDVKEKYPDTYHTFSKDAEKKFRSYWEHIARHFAGKNEKLLFEALNEETDFSNEGSEEKAFATLTRVNQLFIDTVRRTGGNNAQRLLIVTGYNTNFEKTSGPDYRLPRDTVPGRMFVSVHYYAPWTFVGLSSDASWGKMKPIWGSDDDVKQLNDSFDKLNDFCRRTHTPAYIGEFSMCSKKDKDSSRMWTDSVYQAALKRKMVPVLWDTGGAVSRKEPYAPTDGLTEMLKNIKHPSVTIRPSAKSS